MASDMKRVEVRVPEPHQEIVTQWGRTHRPPRPAWMEVDLGRLRENLRRIRAALPAGVRWLAVVKDDAYGHGMLTTAWAAMDAGAAMLGVATLEEGVRLREAGMEAAILLMGERHPDELPFCIEHRLRVSVGDVNTVRVLDRLAGEARVVVPVHLKVNTGMNRFGVPWETAGAVAEETVRRSGLVLEGVMSHLAMSDESDKTYAREQVRRFREVLAALERAGVRPGVRHLCNTGGFLDLPEAHFDMVRLGILPTGVYPSAVCRRLPGVAPVMTVKARIVAVRELAVGEPYGYGMKYRAETPRRIGVLPLGYGDGYPRLRNQGEVLVAGRRVPIVGGVAMDAIGIDLTEVVEARLWDEVVLLGRQGEAEVTAREVATWGGTVCYDVLAGWRSRLPRLELEPG